MNHKTQPSTNLKINLHDTNQAEIENVLKYLAGKNSNSKFDSGETPSVDSSSTNKETETSIPDTKNLKIKFIQNTN